jgi:[ribosomal protein S18]-alanine N-acetyltransferase
MIAIAAAADAQLLAAIHAEAFPPGEAWGADAIALQLALPAVFGLLAPAGGMALVRTAADESELLTLGVTPLLRRHGLGRELLQAAIREATGRGARSMYLEVSLLNIAARALYATAGFAEVGRRPRYYSDGMDALILRAAFATPEPKVRRFFGSKAG